MAVPAGFSLLEVMIAAAIVAVGLAGVSALSLRSVIDTTGARDQTIAALAAAELDALIRMAPAGRAVLLT